jgi:hypothetical protein
LVYFKVVRVDLIQGCDLHGVATNSLVIAIYSMRKNA